MLVVKSINELAPLLLYSHPHSPKNKLQNKLGHDTFGLFGL